MDGGGCSYSATRALVWKESAPEGAGIRLPRQGCQTGDTQVTREVPGEPVPKLPVPAGNLLYLRPP